MNILFVTWDGPQVTYLEGLFVPIFERLRRHGIKVHVLQFTWASLDVIERRRQTCSAAAIPFRTIQVCRRPASLGVLATVFLGALKVRRCIRDWGIDTLMPRSTLPAWACQIAGKGVLPLVFDADGLPLDERLEFGGWKASAFTYRVMRDIEAQAVRRSKIVLVRTSIAATILAHRAGPIDPKKFHIVSNGRDANTFRPITEKAERDATRAQLGLQEGPLIVYAGSFGPQYCTEEMFDLFRRIKGKRADAKLLLLSGSPTEFSDALAKHPDISSATEVRSVKAAEIPTILSCCDFGLALRRRTFSMQAVAPIKVGEYLLTGLPVIVSAGVGDDHLPDYVCFRVGTMDSDNLERAASWVAASLAAGEPDLRSRCHQVGRAEFSLEGSEQSYADALLALSAGREASE